MNKNPYVSLAAIGLLAVIIVALILSGCAPHDHTYATPGATMEETQGETQGETVEEPTAETMDESLTESWTHGRIVVEKAAEENATDTSRMGVFIITDMDTDTQYMAGVDYARGGVGLIQMYKEPGVYG